ncbi:MAG: hypothetical protein LBR44_09190 [Clostridiales Family XIII bacterium]|nr:hypothetical protein [Clostridiales Family XIII bacterium]
MKSFHAVIVTGGSAAMREAAARGILAEHFADDPEAARKIEDGTFEDLIYVEPEEGKQEITVSVVIRLEALMAQRPFASTGKAAVVEGAERLNAAAQNKLLKLLEEPAEGDVVLLLAENPQRLLPTVRSRCIVRRADAPGAPIREDCPEEVKELVRILLFGKDALPAAWAILAGFEKDRGEAARAVRLMGLFLRDLAVGEGAGAKLDDRQRRLCRRAVRHAEEAAKKTETGMNTKYALRDMALNMKTEAMHA